MSDGADPAVGQEVFELAVGGFGVLTDSVEGFEDRIGFGNGCECAGAAAVGFAVPFLGSAVVTDEGGGADEVGGTGGLSGMAQVPYMIFLPPRLILTWVLTR